ncbi:MAG: permease-like cell division protein FtsX [Saprospiraceae bacterium]|nr:permease-like cell division protein FtsX [Saprospiraceae bacterium]
MSRTRPNYLYAISSVALVLFVLGFFALMALHGQKLVTMFKEKVDLWMELKPGLAEADVARLVASVRQQPFVKKESVTFITREQAAATMRKDLGDDSMLDDMPDLMRDVVRFNVKAEYLDNQRLIEWREALRQDSMVSDLYFEAANTSNVGENIRSLGVITLALGVFLIFAAIALIHNTIRLALYSNRFIIKNQELVGASWEFISRPYIQRGIINGLWSAAIAMVALAVTLWWLRQLMPDFQELQDMNAVVLVFSGIAFVGVLISGLSTWWVVNKFLRMRLDDLY